MNKQEENPLQQELALKEPALQPQLSEADITKLIENEKAY
jgi:hypothetical protein